MARIDEVRERYEKITERLYTDRKAFAEYLKYAGKFYKLPTAQTMVMFETNPKATMVADYDTWKKFGHQVQRGANSIAVLNGGELKHLFDISQTAGEKVPYQWTLDKQTAQEFVAAASGCDFDIDMRFNKVVVDAKSFLGVLSLLTYPVMIFSQGNNSEFEKLLEKYAVA